MEVFCPYCSKRIFQVTVSRTYLVHLDTDPADEKLVREEISEARCAGCSRILPPGLWENLRPQA